MKLFKVLKLYHIPQNCILTFSYSYQEQSEQKCMTFHLKQILRSKTNRGENNLISANINSGNFIYYIIKSQKPFKKGILVLFLEFLRCSSEVKCTIPN